MSPTLQRFLLGLGLAHLVAFAVFWGMQLREAQGFVLADGVSPIGGDFVNLWTAGRMVLEGQIGDLYDPARFMALQQERIGAFIGHRLWAYPPHSLALAVPFALLGYLPALALWSLLGLAVLAYGARRAGFGPWQTAILLLSPASMHCIYWGQTGNLACGLLLLALSQRGPRDWVAVGATAALTIKPQIGFMLPVLWALTRQWRLILVVSAAVLAVLALTFVLTGPAPWLGYLFETLPELDGLERHGTGMFVYMIPSVFMALRILTGDGDLAATLHLGVAAVVLAWCVWLILRAPGHRARAALVLVGTAAITPYLHIYDLAMVLAGAMMVARLREAPDGTAHPWAERAVIAAWAMPYITLLLNYAGVPLTPLLMLALLVLAARAPVAAGRRTDAPGPG